MNRCSKEAVLIYFSGCVFVFSAFCRLAFIPACLVWQQKEGFVWIVERITNKERLEGVWQRRVKGMIELSVCDIVGQSVKPMLRLLECKGEMSLPSTASSAVSEKTSRKALKAISFHHAAFPCTLFHTPGRFRKHRIIWL